MKRLLANTIVITLGIAMLPAVLFLAAGLLTAWGVRWAVNEIITD